MSRTLAASVILLCAACTAPVTGQPTSTIDADAAPAATKILSADLDQEYDAARLAMTTDQIAGRGITSEPVLDAMGKVPRHLFVPDRYLDQAYDDHPLPIGFGQTISQPYIVAMMSEALDVEAGQTVLEIGTGSGYQAAVLAEMGLEVFSVEIIPELAEQARHNLEVAGYQGVQILNADGYFGWDEFAPFDAIIVTAAPDHLPQPLVLQLEEGGHLVVPIGPIGAVQSLWVFTKVDGELEAINLGPVRFVPFTRSD